MNTLGNWSIHAPILTRSPAAIPFEPDGPAMVLARLLQGDPPGCWSEIEPDFDQLLQLSIEHGVTLLLTESVRRWDLELPPDQMRRLEVHEAAHRLTRQYRDKLLARALDTLEAAGVRVLLFKGAAISRTHYRLPWLRPSADVDVAVRRRDFQHAQRVLAGAGFRRENSVGGDLVMNQVSLVRQGAGEPPLVIDLHRRLYNPLLYYRLFSIPGLLRRSHKIDLAGSRVRVPADPDQLLISAIHRAAHHRVSCRLIWLYDIYLLSTHLSPADAGQLFETARSKRVSRLLQTTFETVHHYFPHPCLTRLHEELGDPAQPEPGSIFLSPHRNRLDTLLSDFGSAGGFLNRLRWARQHVFPPAAYMKARYGCTGRWQLLGRYLQRLVFGVLRVVAGSRSPAPAGG